MNVLCSYYSNDKRMDLVLDRLSASNDISVFPVFGTLVRTASGVRCLGDRKELVVFGNNTGTPVLLTSSDRFANCNDNIVEYSLAERENIYVQALRLCTDKFYTSYNPFVMECALSGIIITVSAVGKAGDSSVVYAIRTPSGDLLTESSTIPNQLYTQCRAVRSFKYSVVTDTCEKEVVVRKGQVEVFREIAHYINKALVFTGVSNGRVHEYCITPTGCCEVRRFKNGDTKVTKIPFTKIKVDPTCSLSALDCSLDVILKSPGLSQALRVV